MKPYSNQKNMNIFVIGDKQSGKSRLLNYKQSFGDNDLSTFDCNEKKLIVFKIDSDLSQGPDYLRSLLKGNDTVIITADLSKPLDKISLAQYNLMLLKNFPPSLKIIFVGTKADLDNNNNRSELEAFAKRIQQECVITSAETGENIDALFEKLSSSDDDELWDELERKLHAIPEKLAEQLKKETTVVKKSIELHTQFMQLELAKLHLQKEPLTDEEYTAQVQSILKSYKDNCDKHVSHHDNTLRELLYMSIVETAGILLGMAVALSVCSAIGIAGAALIACGIGGVVIGCGVGLGAGLLASRVGLFGGQPNTLRQAVNETADAAAIEANNERLVTPI